MRPDVRVSGVAVNFSKAQDMRASVSKIIGVVPRSPRPSSSDNAERISCTASYAASSTAFMTDEKDHVEGIEVG